MDTLTKPQREMLLKVSRSPDIERMVLVVRHHKVVGFRALFSRVVEGDLAEWFSSTAQEIVGLSGFGEVMVSFSDTLSGSLEVSYRF